MGDDQSANKPYSGTNGVVRARADTQGILKATSRHTYTWSWPEEPARVIGH